jgi:hypothetical protein
MLCICVLEAPLRNDLPSLLGVVVVVWFSAADTLPLSLLFNQCFVVVAAQADALPSMSL